MDDQEAERVVCAVIQHRTSPYADQEIMEPPRILHNHLAYVIMIKKPVQVNKLIFEEQHAGRAGSRERILEEPEERPSSQPRSGSGGRASSFTRETAPKETGAPHGRASFHGGASSQPQASTSRPPAPGVGPPGRGEATAAGRGASRFREQRETVVVTRPSADFDKLGKSKQASVRFLI